MSRVSIFFHIVSIYCYIPSDHQYPFIPASERTTGTLQSEGSLGESMWKGAPDPCSPESLHIQSPPSSYGVHHSPMVLNSRNKFVSQHDKEQHLKARKEKVSGVTFRSTFSMIFIA